MTYTNPENLSNMAEIFRYADGVSDGIFGAGILITLYIVIFSYLKLRGNETHSCFVVSGFITTTTGIFLFLMQIINSTEFFFCVLSLVIPLVITLIDKD